MKKIISGAYFGVLVLGLFIIAPLAHAQNAAQGSLNTAPIQNLSNSLIGILNTVVVPVVFALAFIVFLWGVFQAFILNGANEEKRQEGSKFVFWSIIGFVIMVSIWGLVNLVGSFLPNMVNTRHTLPTFGTEQTSSSGTIPTSSSGAKSGNTTKTSGGLNATMPATPPKAVDEEGNPLTPAPAAPCPSANCIPGTSVPVYGPSSGNPAN